MHCTQCGAEAEGRFCASCGASLKPLKCRGCGAPAATGTRFCTSCGTPVGGVKAVSPQGAQPASRRGGEGKGSGADVGWWIAGGLLLVTFVLVGVGVVTDSDPESAPAVPGEASGAPAGTPPDLSAMSPRQAADRLFNRVMSAAARGDDTEANSFLPMAMDAYGLARPLDDDGLFHLSLLQRAANAYEDALATAAEGLEGNPDHLLNLSSAAEASIQLGQVVEGRAYYEHLLEVWDQEISAGRQEYEEHAPLLPLIREDAEAFLSGGTAP